MLEPKFRVKATGHLASDPKILTSKKGQEYAVCSVAINKACKQQTAEGRSVLPLYVDIVVFDPAGVAQAKTFKKGYGITVDGDGVLNRFTKKDGTLGASIQVVANEGGLTLVTTPSARNAGEPAAAATGTEPASPATEEGTDNDPYGDDIPF